MKIKKKYFKPSIIYSSSPPSAMGDGWAMRVGDVMRDAEIFLNQYLTYQM
jgi:hypothetical protein